MNWSVFVKSNFRGYLDMINSTTDEIYIEMHNSFVKRTDEMRIEKNIGVWLGCKLTTFGYKLR